MRLVDYVVVHELVHLRHRGHGRDYWQAVGRVMPDYERRRDDLRPSCFPKTSSGPAPRAAARHRHVDRPLVVGPRGHDADGDVRCALGDLLDLSACWMRSNPAGRPPAYSLTFAPDP